MKAEGREEEEEEIVAEAVYGLCVLFCMAPAAWATDAAKL